LDMTVLGKKDSQKGERLIGVAGGRKENDNSKGLCFPRLGEKETVKKVIGERPGRGLKRTSLVKKGDSKELVGTSRKPN